MAKRTGFVGLCTMGLPMAVNLNKAGFEVVGYDAVDGSRAKAKAAGIRRSAKPKRLAIIGMSTLDPDAQKPKANS